MIGSKVKNYRVADRTLTVRERNLISAYQFGLIDFFQFLEMWRSE